MTKRVYLPVRPGAVTRISTTAPAPRLRSSRRTRSGRRADLTSMRICRRGQPMPRQWIDTRAPRAVWIVNRFKRTPHLKITPRMRTIGNGLMSGARVVRGGGEGREGGPARPLTVTV